jgi:hypothetical protein
MPTRVQKIISAAVGLTGLALMAMMIAMESEPGLIPLVLVLAGAIGYAVAQLHGKRRRKGERGEAGRLDQAGRLEKGGASSRGREGGSA